MERTSARPILVRLAAAAGALLLAGCLTVGRDFPAQRVEKLRVGGTTRAQVRDLFGDPWRTGVEDGQRTWTYGRYRYALLGETQTKDLVVRFDERDVVASYTFNSTDPNDAPD
jgi:outer membrane protein assembly factor BamE (lipoprotein component of BamABCDE complex)